MARIARYKVTDQDAWYHLYSRIAGYKGEYKLSKPLVTNKLIDMIRHFGKVYFCEIAAFCTLGNHYHAVCKFECAREVSRTELRRRAHILYPSEASRNRIKCWSESKWQRFEERLFDVSEYMRSVQSSFARWYNRTFQRRGRFWADRFKSVLLQGPDSLLDCMLYVDLNPVRAGLVERPEQWKGSSIYLRELGHDSWLMPLQSKKKRDTVVFGSFKLYFL